MVMSIRVADFTGLVFLDDASACFDEQPNSDFKCFCCNANLLRGHYRTVITVHFGARRVYKILEREGNGTAVAVFSDLIWLRVRIPFGSFVVGWGDEG